MPMADGHPQAKEHASASWANAKAAMDHSGEEEEEQPNRHQGQWYCNTLQNIWQEVALQQSQDLGRGGSVDTLVSNKQVG